jgi:hypothetical protein
LDTCSLRGHDRATRVLGLQARHFGELEGDTCGSKSTIKAVVFLPPTAARSRTVTRNPVYQLHDTAWAALTQVLSADIGKTTYELSGRPQAGLINPSGCETKKKQVVYARGRAGARRACQAAQSRRKAFNEVARRTRSPNHRGSRCRRRREGDCTACRSLTPNRNRDRPWREA